MNKILSTIFVMTFLALAPGAGAQIFEAVSSAAINITPEFPEPFSEIKARLTSFSFDVNRAQIQWTLNGQLIAQGVGAKEAAFQAGPLGSVGVLKVVAIPEGMRAQIVKIIEISPQAIDLLLEPQSFIPPWYKGAAVISPASRAEVVAVPHFILNGSRLDPKTLTYNWSVDGEARGDASGRGRQSFAVQAPALTGAGRTISVKVSSGQGNLESETQTSFEAQSPELLFYERRPLAGLITSEALSAKTIPAGSNLEVLAVPFFMNFSSPGELNFNWSFDGKAIETNPREPDTFLVKSLAGTTGGAVLNLLVGNLKNLLEQVSGSLQVYVQ